jgi:hypothetical protein
MFQAQLESELLKHPTGHPSLRMMLSNASHLNQSIGIVLKLNAYASDSPLP